MLKEVIYEQAAAKRFDPLAAETLAIEEKLAKLSAGQDGKIQGVTPLRTRAPGKPPNTGVKKISGVPLLIAPEGSGAIVILDVV